MLRTVRPALPAALFLGLFALLASGCSSLPLLAALDVLNAAETGKTGYDMVTGLNARKSLEMDESPDAQAEARLRAALDSQGGSLKRAIPHVSQGRAYVVGTYTSPQELERAHAATRNIKGVTEITLCLFRQGSGPPRAISDSEVRDNILRLAGVRTREVRVNVIEGNAVLTGSVRTKAEQDRLQDSAQVAGAASIRNYVRLAALN